MSYVIIITSVFLMMRTRMLFYLSTVFMPWCHFICITIIVQLLISILFLFYHLCCSVQTVRSVSTVWNAIVFNSHFICIRFHLFPFESPLFSYFDNILTIFLFFYFAIHHCNCRIILILFCWYFFPSYQKKQSNKITKTIITSTSAPTFSVLRERILIISLLFLSKIDFNLTVVSTLLF